MSDRLTTPPPSADALTPADVARRLESANIKRAVLPVRSLLILGLLGGVYIAMGGALATLALTDNSLGFGLGRLAAGVAFSLGLILLVLAGGELFTGNNLIRSPIRRGRYSWPRTSPPSPMRSSTARTGVWRPASRETPFAARPS